ncbi:MAG: methyltransferase domain-containing protein [Bacteroidetes bacterium]|nr:MAG: methyltransferase domain-containing protein [Bacteroidota bacterium]
MTTEKTCCDSTCCTDEQTETQVQTQTEQCLKDLVVEKYSQIANQTLQDNLTSACGCGGGCGTDIDYTIMSDSYENLAGYNPDADLGLGCGLPTEFAQIKAGDTVVDLGSGAGNDCFVARAIAGESGRVIGIDMTPVMVSKARANAEKLGFQNVEFYLGEIEQMPLPTETADVVVSNCVLNLVPNKPKALAETYRIMKKGGHFSISDIVLQGNLPAGLQQAAEMYAGCVSGAMQEADYLELIVKTGFRHVQVQKTKPIMLPDSLLEQFLSVQELADFKASRVGIFSITVYAEKV